MRFQALFAFPDNHFSYVHKRERSAFYVQLFICFFFCELVEVKIAKIESEVYAYHDKVDKVEYQNVPFCSERIHVCFIEKFRSDTCYVTDKNEEKEGKEGKTLAFRRSCLPGFDCVKRPGYTEANYHDNFQNFCHYYVTSKDRFSYVSYIIQ